MEEIFSGQYVDSDRILYTPSPFAREGLVHLQEIGKLQALRRHISRREKLDSYLFFMVESGAGTLTYQGVQHFLRAGDCVFISCIDAYAHETSDDFWHLRWIHFNGPQMPMVYDKYCERGGKPIFRPQNIDPFVKVFQTLYETASSGDYIRDMRINEGLNALLTLLMQESWQADAENISPKRKDLVSIKEYLHKHHTEKISLDELAERFFINKYYLTRIFKEQFGTSINQYLLQLRITSAKRALRFTDDTVEEIGYQCGLGAPHYFSRMFKKMEGISPSEFRAKWKN